MRPAGFDARDPRLLRLVAELDEGSAEFRALWNSHEVRGKTAERAGRAHPAAGGLPGSPSADALALLGSLHAPAKTS